MSRGANTPVCRCTAYPFPHSFMAGACDGYKAVEAVFEMGTPCADCKYYSEQEEPHGERLSICGVLEQDFKRYHSVSPRDCPGLEGNIVKGLI